MPAGGPMLRLEGFEASVAHRAKVLAAALAPFGAAAVEDGATGRRVRDAAAFAGREGAVWRVSVRPSDGPAVGARLAGAEVIYDWAGGLLWVLAPEALDLRAALAGMAGHATLVRAERGGEGAAGRVPPRAGAGRGDRGRAPRAVRPAGHPEPRPDGRRGRGGGLMQTNFTPEQLADPATARSNRILRTCVHCGFCTATCPTYQVLGDELD